MSELIAINIISAQMNISSRALRHWEDMGLFKSTRDPQSGWRMYDKEALSCIRITDLLRCIDLSIEDIKKILDNKSVGELLNALKRQLKRLETITEDLDKRHTIISEIIEIIQNKQILSLAEIENILMPVAVKRTKKQLNNYIEEINNMPIFGLKYEHEYTITALPPMRTAACHHYGDEPENPDPALTWIKENNLLGTARFFGFNTEALPTDSGPGFGYDFCVSIPENTFIPDYLYEKKLPGGLYAAFSNIGISMGKLWDKINAGLGSSEFEWDFDHERICLEEHTGGVFGLVYSPLAITVLIPVKKKP